MFTAYPSSNVNKIFFFDFGEVSVKTRNSDTFNPIGDVSNPMDECRSFKTEYDKCFNIWFRDKFLKGNDDDSMCSELLKNYTGCVKRAMKDKDIDIGELKRYHLEMGYMDEPSKK